MRVSTRMATLAVAAAALAPAGAAAASVDFAPRITTATGGPAYAVALADLNADGGMDAVVATGPSSVTIHRGLAGGAFSAGSLFGVGASPQGVAVADFNGDGKPDVAASNFEARTVSILLGDGTGQLMAGPTLAVGSGPFGIAAGDLNADGKVDLVVMNINSANGSLLVGNGDGTFQASTFFAVGASAFDVAIGDVTGDGAPDLVIAGGALRIIPGPLGATIPAGVGLATGLGAVRVALGDVNRDGRLDIATANLNSNQVSTLLNLGGTAFTVPASADVSWGPGALALADVNGDGVLDLATANVYSGDVSVLEGFPGGGFGPGRQFRTGLVAQGIQAADLNGDGRADLVVASGDGAITSLIARPLAAGSAGTATTRTPCATPKRVIRGLAISCVPLQTSRAQVREILGPPRAIRRASTGEIEWVYRKLFVDFDAGANTVSQIGTQRPGAGLANGVRVGAPGSLVKKRFPKARCLTRNGVRFCQVNAALTFTGIVIKGTTITEIDVGVR